MRLPTNLMLFGFFLKSSIGHCFRNSYWFRIKGTGLELDYCDHFIILSNLTGLQRPKCSLFLTQLYLNASLSFLKGTYTMDMKIGGLR